MESHIHMPRPDVHRRIAVLAGHTGIIYPGQIGDVFFTMAYRCYHYSTTLGTRTRYPGEMEGGGTPLFVATFAPRMGALMPGEVLTVSVKNASTLPRRASVAVVLHSDY